MIARPAIDFSASMTQNAIQSPLLRLPAELRNMIWDYAYSGVETDVLSQGKGYMALVCNQYWAETLPLILTTSLFAFDDPKVFQAFLLSSHDHVARIGRISIRAHASLAFDQDDTDAWGYCIYRIIACGVEKHRAVRLRMLEGLSLKLCSRMGEDCNIFDNIDVMNPIAGDPEWGGHELHYVIRYFQRHKSKEELTFCEVQDEGRDRKALEIAIRFHSLDFTGRAGAKFPNE